jgi:lysine biosynthesis protein LysW
MSMNQLAMEVRGECPVCAAGIIAAEGVEESEILTCPECQSKLVVDSRQGQSLILSEAPIIEEDWGE